MKKILILFLLLIAINAQGQGLPVPANATLASLFPDENLRRVVARRLGNNVNLTGQALSDELARIEWLDAVGSGRLVDGISNTAGIEYLIGLTTLTLIRYSLTAINMDTLTNLKYLDLNGNRLNYINLNNLISLETLDLTSN